MFLWCSRAASDWIAGSQQLIRFSFAPTVVWNLVFPEHVLRNLAHSSWMIRFSIVSVIFLRSKTKERLHSSSKSSELHTPSLEAQTHSRLLSNLSPWSWVGSCVQLRLMKASHLDDRSENEGPRWLLSKGPKWPLFGEEAALSASTQAPFNLPLLCKHLVIQPHTGGDNLVFYMSTFFLSPSRGDKEDQRGYYEGGEIRCLT